ncbi:MAG: bifunctional 5,10-methylene-tetrahydrofolate dehydrogenase/5,10-methylene-tetrahydrofolate cyclohydrolase [Candidatus Neomarinimicrobiota bacterium]|nr:MAG: bifunctional 5,10-methylene-tetrahydrofolate dehydrogenase/5,10-methylene-tetrahydrofolate cyclohydrolase [Candidatus Neomarinimicrobiota bacterium]
MSQPLILSGKEVARTVYQDLQPRIARLKAKGVTPGLAVILVGDDPASRVYVRSKSRRFENLDLISETFTYPADISQAQLLDQIGHLNHDPRFHGILVQMPLPSSLDEAAVIEAISPEKDVDGFHPYNVGRLTSGQPTFIPCTPKGILRILSHYHLRLDGKHVVVVGRSNIVGRPLSILASLKNPSGNATTTLCHSRTRDIFAHTSQADVVVAALGQAEFIRGEHVRDGVILIDVGINRLADSSEKGYHLTGDVHFPSAAEKAAAITPVPGGVGPMTIAMLVENTVEAAEKLTA